MIGSWTDPELRDPLPQSRSMDLLIDWLYWEPVGHMVEALKVSRGLASENSGLRITILLNSRAPLPLAEGCPWVDSVVPIDLSDVQALGADAPCYQGLRPDWDFVIHNELPQREAEDGGCTEWEERAFLAHRDILDERLRPRRGAGSYFPVKLPDGLGHDREASVRLEVPEDARAWAQDRCIGEPRIAVLPAGSGTTCRYPSVEAWSHLLTEMQRTLPSASFFLTGRSESLDGQTSTTVLDAEAREALSAQVPRLGDCFDIGLWRQLALIEACDLLVSPHSGFAFLAPCVGTPWLSISGGDWSEYLFQDVPFWCDLPDDPGFPHRGALDTWNRFDKIPGMSDAELRSRTPGIVGGARCLLRDDFDFAAAEAQYEAALATASVRVEAMPRPPLLRF